MSARKNARKKLDVLRQTLGYPTSPPTSPRPSTPISRKHKAPAELSSSPEVPLSVLHASWRQSSPPRAERRDSSTSPEVPLAERSANRHDSLVKRKANDPLGTGSPKRPKQESPDSALGDAPPEPKKRIVPFPEKPAVVEERHGEIEFRVVNNDGRRESTIILTGLKCIFQKQLPKMPKDYIARLVYDRTHLSIAIVKHPLEVVGSVAFQVAGIHIH